MVWDEFLDKLNRTIAKALVDRTGTEYVSSYAISNVELEQVYTDAMVSFVAGTLLRQMLSVLPEQRSLLLFVTTKPFAHGRVIELHGYELDQTKFFK